MYELRDKVILITGGAGRMGSGVVEAFLKEGVTHVAALDIDVERSTEIETELKGKYGGHKVKFYKCDITTHEFDEAFEMVLKEFGSIDVVVNSAGLMSDSSELFMKTIELNMSALIKISLKAYEYMRKDHGGKGGTIMNVSCITGIFQASFVPVYCATKCAVLQFSNCLGMEPHYSRSGVRVVTLCPGFTYSALFTIPTMASLDTESNKTVVSKIGKLPFQQLPSNIEGVIYAYKHGASGTTWLSILNKQAEDITENISEAYKVMGRGILDKK